MTRAFHSKPTIGGCETVATKLMNSMTCPAQSAMVLTLLFLPAGCSKPKPSQLCFAATPISQATTEASSPNREVAVVGPPGLWAAEETAFQPLMRTHKTGDPQDPSTLRFTSLSPDETGVEFANRLDLEHPLKQLYESGFVCGCVAVGDIDGDRKLSNRRSVPPRHE